METKEAVYLCQVGESVSCGACCGLYNVPDASAAGIRSLLKRRTVSFAGVPREMDAIADFGRRETALLGNGHPLSGFHHCPFIGLIGSGQSRVGCLLHPLGEGNRGIDFRSVSHYGAMVCHVYFCPTHRRLSPDFRQCLISVLDDWYLYGLVVPETDLLAACHDQIAGRTGSDRIDHRRAVLPEARSLWTSLLTLKVRWPYRAPHRPLANYFFNDCLYPKPAVDYSKTSCTGSRYDVLFYELQSVFGSDRDLAVAEAFLDDLFDRLADAMV